MEWIEWLLSREFRQFVLDHNLFIPLLFLARIVILTTLELIAPARKISYRSVFLYDLIGCILAGYILIPASEVVSNRIALRASLPEAILALPVAASFMLYYIIGDFGAYWMHRLMHSKPVWRVHKWHHSPRTMYWLAGYRASLPQQTLFNLPWIFAYSVFGFSPWWLYLTVMSSHMLLNDWMHMNVSWRSNWLEVILVTPRYHHIHHSDNPAYSNSNFGVTFTMWDRMFGTYVAPEAVQQPISFGIGEEVPLIRLVAGV